MAYCIHYCINSSFIFNRETPSARSSPAPSRACPMASTLIPDGYRLQELQISSVQCKKKRKKFSIVNPPCHGACARVEKNSPKRTKLVPGPLNRVDGRQLRRCSGSVWTRSQPFFRVQRVGARGPVVDSALNRRLAGNEHASPSLVCRYGVFSSCQSAQESQSCGSIWIVRVLVCLESRQGA